MTFRKTTVARVLLYLALLLPLLVLLWDYSQNRLTADPIREATLRSGKMALLLLIASLACTPAFSAFGYLPLLRLRRTLGLSAFGYAALHLYIFVGVDYGFNAAYLREGLLEKPFALLGLAAFLILLPLALTSSRGWQRRLGRSWSLLHSGVYLAAILAASHFVLLVKAGAGEPLTYAAVIVILLVLRSPAVAGALRRWRRYRPA